MSMQAEQSGWVNWPTSLKDLGEGGMWVYAFWAADFDRNFLGVGEYLKQFGDPFINCCGPETVISLPLPGAVAGNSRDKIYIPDDDLPSPMEDREGYYLAIRDAGVPVLGGICLGTSAQTWWDTETQNYWQCGEDDLTQEGQDLVVKLNALYERDSVLITYLAA